MFPAPRPLKRLPIKPDAETLPVLGKCDILPDMASSFLLERESLLHLLNPLLSIQLIMRHHDLLSQLLRRNLATRYRGSVLGLVWSFAHPLMMLAVYTFVFGIVFKSRWGIDTLNDNPASFPLIMFCGMAVFNVFSESVNSSAGLIVGNPSYVKKVIFPLELLPICNVLTSLIFGLAWFALLMVGSGLFLHQFSWTMLLLPITLVPLLLISCGVSFLVASLGVYLRDIQQLVSIITQILFFMTPIFYPISIVPEKLRWILELNPLSAVVDETRKIFLYGQLPNWWTCLGIFILSCIIFQLGFAWFAKTKKGFADIL